MEQGDLSVAFSVYLEAALLLGCDEPFTELQREASKFLFISGIGLVNCVAYGKYL
jgi:hypothetical protein